MPEEEYIELDQGYFVECDSDYKVFDLPQTSILQQTDLQKESEDVRRHELKDDRPTDD